MATTLIGANARSSRCFGRFYINDSLVMRHFSFSYSVALSLARANRPMITPNGGFERQLRIWEHCSYSIYLDEADAASNQSQSSTSQLETEDTALVSETATTIASSSSHQARKVKAAYKAWLAANQLQCGEVDVNRARWSSMAGVAARFGRLRQDQHEKDDSNADSDKTTSTWGTILGNEEKRRESWERVQKMEKEWNEKLIRGLVGESGEEQG